MKTCDEFVTRRGYKTETFYQSWHLFQKIRRFTLNNISYWQQGKFFFSWIFCNFFCSILENICICIRFYCYSQISDLIITHLGRSFLVYKKPSSPMVCDWGRLKSVSSNGRNGFLNKCFMLDCFTKMLKQGALLL